MICRLRCHSWLYIPGLIFIVIQYKLVFSYQTKPARVSTTLNKQPPDKVRFFEPNTNLTICQTCQRTTGLSSLTVGFKILVYLDQYSNVLTQTLHMCFDCESRWLWFFCQPVHCACVKMTSRVGKHETSYRTRVDTWHIVYLSYKDPCPKISVHKNEIKVH